MTQQQPKDRLVDEVKSAISSVMPGATLMDLPSPLAREVVSITAFDAEDKRTATELLDAFAAHLGGSGWAVEPDREAAEPTLHAVREGVGGGAFSCQPAAVSFSGLPESG
ncbi:hypothetical protein [Streptomyces sp. SCSIO ZS0520]|uniref:hypothetical protein n=1 Tax=Streptomyces sp. SCSIO ZS0520 TaxID=2892996 RepID=UPI0021D8F395|nr:hypothetical protein [Streptomyces sp. SCSIO ZS0520]